MFNKERERENDHENDGEMHELLLCNEIYKLISKQQIQSSSESVF